MRNEDLEIGKESEDSIEKGCREDARGELLFLYGLAKLPALPLLAAVSAPLLESTTDMMKLDREMLPSGALGDLLHTAEELGVKAHPQSALSPVQPMARRERSG